MKLIWSEEAWSDYQYWIENDKKNYKKVNQLIKDISRNQNSGIGKPEPLKYYDGYWSRRIDKKNRIIYRINEGNIEIVSCRGHYN